MTKRFFIFLFVFLTILHSKAYNQNRTNIWMLSKQYVAVDCGIDFNSGIADTFSLWKNLELYITNASICDTLGQLQFYTNGIFIANKNNDTLQNSKNFNPGYATDYYGSDGLGITQGVIILPLPDSAGKYVIIHVSADIAEFGNAQPLVLRYSIVDMSLDNGLGGVVPEKKGVDLFIDTLVLGRITACKHSNGRDWWIITHRWNSDLYFKFLLTPDTIIGTQQQHIGSIINKDDIFGQACFSPDGSKFVYMNRNFNFDYMEFDRCNGMFSNAINIPLDSNTSQGISFSPNSRFIYASNFNELYQFDTWSDDLPSSKLLIDSVPFIQTGIPDWFGVQMLAPDNKIYISTYNGVTALHVINFPDSLGAACGFVRQGLPLPSYNVYSIPNHPNYDLGELAGNDTCEVIYTAVPVVSQSTYSYRIAPNPVSNWLNINYLSNEDALFELFDLYGKRVGATSLFHYFKNRFLNVSDLPSGVYLGTVTCKGERIWSEKVMVQR